MAAGGKGLWLWYMHPFLMPLQRNLENFTIQKLFLIVNCLTPLCAMWWWSFFPDHFDAFSLCSLFDTLQCSVKELELDCLQVVTTSGKDLLWTAQGWYLGPGASSFKSHRQQLGVQALKPGYGEWKLGLRLPDGKKSRPDGTKHLLRSGPWRNWCYMEARNVL